MTLLKISKLQGFVYSRYGKRKRDWMAKVVFFDKNASNFRRPLQSLLLKHMDENSQVN